MAKTVKTDQGRIRRQPKSKAARPVASESEVDSSTLESFVGYNLRRAAARQRERFKFVFGPYDIRPVQLTILALIRDSMPIKQAALGKALEVKGANVVTLLDELEGRGLVTRQPADDRRSHMLYLTPTGKMFTDKLLALHAKLEKDLARVLGQQELARLVGLLRAFRALESRPKLR